MNVSIELDRQNKQYTNLDILSGRVLVRNPSPTGINSITIKLEGESVTRLYSTGLYSGDKEKPLAEMHKLLYRTITVFPDPNIHQNVPGKPGTFYLDSGAHIFPFQFKVPFNNVCDTLGSLANNTGFIGRSIEATRTGNHHVKKTLPPTLYYPPEAEIRYYLKATVRRPQLFKENPRAWEPVNFFPIEPPRPARSDGEAYGRRQHVFQPLAPGASQRRSSFFSGLRGKSDQPALPDPSQPLEPVRVSVDARLPNPPILTCNADIPLKLILKQLSDRKDQVYLQTLQIELKGFTYLRAHEVSKVQTHSWIVCSHSNLAMPLGSPGDAPGTESQISPELWFKFPLPNTVAPSFTTCNIERRYELEIRAGLGYGSAIQGKNDQFATIPIRLAVLVYSGIAPPAALLEAMSKDSERPPQRPPRPTVAPQNQNNPGVSPINPSGAQPQLPQYNTVQNAYDAPLQNSYNDPPPSYEDAIADTIPPVDGPRPNYQPPVVPDGERRYSTDEKGRSS